MAVDILSMNMVGNIADYVLVQAQIEYQMAVAARIMQTAQGQGEAVVRLLNDAVESLEKEAVKALR